MPNNYRHYPQPIIIGTELTGLLVSIALSRARIAHVLIGEAPDDRLPRLGQILTPVGTPTFVENFPELAHLGYPKKQRVVHIGDYYMQLDFSHHSIAPILSTLTALGGLQFTKPWNLDRVATDKALFEKAVNAPYCRHVPSQASSVVYDQTEDRIRSVTVTDGTEIRASHVFDASGTDRFVGRQLGLAYRSLGGSLSLVHASYTRASARSDADLPAGTPSTAGMPQADWYQHRASVIRLYQPQDGMDGMATCVPLGDHVSIHVSTPMQTDSAEEVHPFSVVEMLAAARKGFERVGACYEAYFPVCAQSGQDIQEQYVGARAFGTNWLLTGSAYSNTLVTIAASTDTSFAAFYAGVPFLRDASTVGAMYQKYWDYALTMQESWHWTFTHTPETASRSLIQHYLNRYVWANQVQYFVFLQLKYYKNPLRPGFKLINQMTDIKWLSRLSPAYISIEKIRIE